MSDAILWEVRVQPARSLVELQITRTFQPGESFSLPAWIPGSYLVREFVRGVQDLAITDEHQRTVPVEKTEKATWRVACDSPTRATLQYTVYAHELTVRTAHVDDTHAFFNGAHVFMRFPDSADAPHDIRVTPPEGWRAFVSLPLHDGAFRADDYIHLADTVFELGDHTTRTFTVDGVPHRLIFWGDGQLPIDFPRLEADTIALIQQNKATFGGELPYERYDFVFHISPNGYGGLEHRDSTTLAVGWNHFETEDGYLDMLTLIAHEHFHAWNGRRITPAALQFPEFQRENYTHELWVIEGFTSYYDELNTMLAGRMTRQQWIERLAKSLNALQKVHGRHRQALTESSFDAWIRLYRPYEHTRNQTVSYYLKGAIVALAIDLRIQQATDNQRDLSHVLRELWRQWTTARSAYTTHDVLALIRSIAGDHCADDAQRWVTTTEEPPLEALLATQDIRLTTDEQGTDFGFDWRAEGSAAIVSSVDEARGDDLQALQPGDEIIAINQRRVHAGELRARLQSIAKNPANASAHVLLFRLGRQRDVTITLKSAPVIQLHDDRQTSTTPAQTDE